MHVIINVGILKARACEDDCMIPTEKRPTYVHHDKDSAEKELLRLASHNPGTVNRFVLFSAIAETEFHGPWTIPMQDGAYVVTPFKA